MTETIEPSPAALVRDFIISRLQELQSGLQTTQIRAMLDVSGDRPVGTESIIVTAADMGGHSGLPGRTLVDVEAQVSILTHLDEDATGSRNDELEALIMQSLSQIPRPTSLNGWCIRFEGIWQGGAPSIVNETFRKRDLTATLFLQKNS